MAPSGVWRSALGEGLAARHLSKGRTITNFCSASTALVVLSIGGENAIVEKTYGSLCPEAASASSDAVICTTTASVTCVGVCLTYIAVPRHFITGCMAW